MPQDIRALFRSATTSWAVRPVCTANRMRLISQRLQAIMLLFTALCVVVTSKRALLRGSCALRCIWWRLRCPINWRRCNHENLLYRQGWHVANVSCAKELAGFQRKPARRQRMFASRFWFRPYTRLAPGSAGGRDRRRILGDSVDPSLRFRCPIPSAQRIFLRSLHTGLTSVSPAPPDFDKSNQIKPNLLFCSRRCKIIKNVKN